MGRFGGVRRGASVECEFVGIGGRLGRRRCLRVDRHAGTNLRQTADDDAFPRLEAGAHDALAVRIVAQVHTAVLRGVALVDHVDVFAVLIGADGALVDQRGGGGAATGASKSSARLPEPVPAVYETAAGVGGKVGPEVSTLRASTNASGLGDKIAPIEPLPSAKPVLPFSGG